MSAVPNISQIAALPGSVRRVPIRQLKLCQAGVPLSEDVVERIRYAMYSVGGMAQPVLVDVALRLVDGKHRVEAAKRNGMTQIDVKILPTKLSTETRAVFNLLLNTARVDVTWSQILEALPAVLLMIRSEQARRKRDAGRLAGEYRWHSIDHPAVSPTPLLVEEHAKFVTPIRIVSRKDVSTIPIAADGTTRSTLREIFGRSERDISRALELSNWAASDDVSPRVREAAVHALQQIDRKPGTLAFHHKTVWELIESEKLSDRQRELMKSLGQSEKYFKQILTVWEAIRSLPPERVIADLTGEEIAALGAFHSDLGDLIHRVETVQAQQRERAGEQR